MEPAQLATLLREIAREARATAAQADALADDYALDAALAARLAEHAENWRDYVTLARREYGAQRRRSVRRALLYAIVRAVGG